MIRPARPTLAEVPLADLSVTADFDLFSRWFTVEGFSAVVDVGQGPVGEEA
jgi:hypothetical protein